jgi:hypothetical protein
MSAEPVKDEKAETGPPTDAKRVIHRVFITSNNMFRVTPENYDAMQCPNCHKGD